MTTRSTGTGSARFIGRVGGLAVALGIGVAIANGSAIAAADTGSDSSPSSSSSVRTPHKPSLSHVKKKLDNLTSKVQTAFDNAAARSPKRSKITPHAVSRTVGAVKSQAALDKSEKLPTKKRSATDVPTVTATVDTVRAAADRTVNTVVDQAVSTVRTAPRNPANPLQELSLAATLNWARKESRSAVNSVLGTPQQLSAEQQVSQITNTPVVQVTKAVLMATWYVEALKNFSAVGGPDATNLSQLNEAATEYANQSATEFLLLNSNDPKLLLQVNPPHSWYGQDAGGTRIWYDNPDTVYRFTGVNGASTYRIDGAVAGYDPDDPSTHPTSANTNISVLTGINGVTAANLSGEDLSIRDDGTFTIIVSPDPAPADPEKGMNYLRAPSDVTILATRNTLSDWNTDEPMTLTIEQVDGPPSSLFSQIGGFAIPVIGSTVVENPALRDLVSTIPPFQNPPLILSATETALLMLVTGISGENTYMSVATATGAPNTLSAPAHNAQFLSTQLQSAGYFQLNDDEAIIITVDPGDAEYFVVPVTNDWTITGNTRDQQTSLNNSQAVKNADGTYTIVVSKNDPGIANWVSTGGLNQGTISMRFQGVDPDSTEMPTVTTQVVKLDEVDGYLTDPAQYDYDRAQQIADRQAGYDKRYTA